ncbi:hypothetical protein V6N13_021208 [Hibiscus sabdariffa]|uniref:Uncharacterized protein n=1 Tax=Hibiscus sabdariffa TaxID=183260 RepID=A0ABR2EVV2_9ROSI
MAKIVLIVLLSFALILSAKPILGQEEEPKDSAGSELGPAPAGGAAEEAADGVDISSDQLKKIGSEVKEAFQNIEDNVGEEISPEQEEQLLGEFAKDLAPSPGEDDLAPTSDDGDADAPSAEGEDAGGPSAEGGAAGGPSAEGGDAGGPSAEGGAAGGPSAEGGAAGGPSAEGGAAGGPSAEGGAAGGPSAEGGVAGGPSAEGGDAGAPSGASDATSPGAAEADSPKDSL